MGTKKVANKKGKGPNKHSGRTNHLEGRKAEVPTTEKNSKKLSVETTAPGEEVAKTKGKGPNKHSGRTNHFEAKKAKVPTMKKNSKKRSVETTAPGDASPEHTPNASDSEYIPDPDLSAGEKEGPSEMLSDGERPTKKQRCVAPPKRQKTNVACRVEHYLSVVRSLSHRKRGIVRQMGFESLLDFNVTRLNRKFI